MFHVTVNVNLIVKSVIPSINGMVISVNVIVCMQKRLCLNPSICACEFNKNCGADEYLKI